MSKFYCKQVRQTKTFTSYRTSQIFQIKSEKYLLLYVDYTNFNMMEKWEFFQHLPDAKSEKINFSNILFQTLVSKIKLLL